MSKFIEVESMLPNQFDSIDILVILFPATRNTIQSNDD